MSVSATYWKNEFEKYLEKQFDSNDGSHDLGHFRRVWNNACQIMQDVQADELVVLTACYFHDIVNLPKNHPERKRASSLAADKTLSILKTTFPDFSQNNYAAIHHAISAHSYSAQIKPESIEAKIVQDADRLEALGAIGLARVFYISGALGQSLFDSDDLFANERKLDDKRFALDHFQQKLLHIPQTMHTAMGRRIAKKNANFLVHFMAKLSSEVRGDNLVLDKNVLSRFSFDD